MIAKIVDKDKREYYSYVFAICDNGWDTAVIVYDNEKRRFSFVKMYKFTKNLVRSVFLIDCNEDGFIKNKSITVNFLITIKHINGYDWLVENKELFIAIIKGKQVDEIYTAKAEELNQSLTIDEWTFVKNEQDVNNLMSTAWGFHDGIIEKISYENEDKAEVLISGCWGSKITLRFHSDIAIRFSQYEFQYIMNSNVFFENGFVYWVDDYNIKCEADLYNAKEINYFRARALSWKQETEYDSPYDKED